MWSDSNGKIIKSILKKIDKTKISDDSKEILNVALLTNSYIPQKNITAEEFLDFKTKYLIKSEDLKTQMANGYIPVDTPDNMVKTLLKIHNYSDAEYIRPEHPEAWT